jgi:hypothetical protein
MAIWTNVPDSNLEPGDPIRSVDIIAIKDNTTALAEGASGAPEIYQKATLFSARAQVFATAGSGQSFTIPTGVIRLKVTVVGGGGVGGSGPFDFYAGGFTYGAGGGGGGASIKWLAVTGGTLLVTVGGSAQASSVSSGTQSITTISATAGGAGGSGNTTPGAGGAGSNGDLNIDGDDGTVPAGNLGGKGGATILAPSKVGPQSGAGFVGPRYGGGGTGQGISGSPSNAAGGAGVVIFEW